MAGLLMLWIVMGKVCTKLQAVLFSENSPTIGWVNALQRGDHW